MQLTFHGPRAALVRQAVSLIQLHEPVAAHQLRQVEFIGLDVGHRRCGPGAAACAAGPLGRTILLRDAAFEGDLPRLAGYLFHEALHIGTDANGRFVTVHHVCRECPPKDQVGDWIYRQGWALEARLRGILSRPSLGEVVVGALAIFAAGYAGAAVINGLASTRKRGRRAALPMFPELIDLLATRGIVPDARGTFVRAEPWPAGVKPVSDDILIAINTLEADDTAENNLRLRNRWILDLNRYATAMLDGAAKASQESIAMFWLRLGGLLIDVRSQPRRLLRAAGVDPDSPEPTTNTGIRYLLRFHGLIEVVRTEMSRDELIYAEYRRHVEAHLVQDGYSAQLARNGKYIRTRPVHALDGAVLPLIEINAAVARVEADGDPAIRVAQRLVPGLAALAAFVSIEERERGRWTPIPTTQ